MNKVLYLLFLSSVLVSCNQNVSKEQDEYIKNLEEKHRVLEDEIRKIKDENDSLKLLLTKEETERNRGYFIIGSTMDKVISVMGEPESYIVTAPEARRFHYGLSTVYFYQDKVISYDNLENNLRVKVK